HKLSFSTPPRLVTNVWGSSASAGRPDPVAAFRRRATSACLLVRKLEAQRPRYGIGLGDAQLQLLPLAVCCARILADKLLRLFVIAEIFVSDGRDGHPPIATELDDGREEAERLDAGDPAQDHLPALVGQEGGDVAVDGLALRLHRSA